MDERKQTTKRQMTTLSNSIYLSSFNNSKRHSGQNFLNRDICVSLPVFIKKFHFL